MSWLAAHPSYPSLAPSTSTICCATPDLANEPAASANVDLEEDAVSAQLRNIQEIEKKLELLRQQYRFHAREVKRLSPKKPRDAKQSQLAALGPIMEELPKPVRTRTTLLRTVRSPNKPTSQSIPYHIVLHAGFNIASRVSLIDRCCVLLVFFAARTFFFAARHVYAERAQCLLLFSLLYIQLYM